MNDGMITSGCRTPAVVVVLAQLLGLLQLGQGLEQSNRGDERRIYAGHKLLRVQPRTEDQVETLYRLFNSPPAELQGLDFWNKPTSTLNSVDVSADPERAARLESYLNQIGLPYTLIASDLQSLIDANAVKNRQAKSVWRQSIYDSYLSYEEMMTWLEDAVSRCSFCTLESIGKSYEGRDLNVIKISTTRGSSGDGAARQSTRKSSVWIDAGIHAREWISHATALFFIDRLISDYDYDSDIRELLEAYDWYVLPCVNPDGYHFSHTTNRLWRKTRSRFNDSSCVGVDANRNFDYHWGSVGTSESPCTDVYRGPVAFSERETAAIRDFVLARNGTWKLFLTLHSYGQKFLVPYGYTTDKPRNYNDMMTVGNAAKAAIENVFGTQYTVGSASDILYRSSGTTRDWAAGAARIPYVYTIELRDTGRHGFLLPATEILPTGSETWEGLKEMVRQINRIDDANEIVDIDLKDLLLMKELRRNI